MVQCRCLIVPQVVFVGLLTILAWPCIGGRSGNDEWLDLVECCGQAVSFDLDLVAAL